MRLAPVHVMAAIAIVFAVGIFMAQYGADVAHYERFRINGSLDGEFCEQYYESCTCYGTHVVRESYPPQHVCEGYETCHPIARTECDPGAAE